MSGYTAKDFKVGEPIDEKVAAQVQLLQEIFGSKDSGAKRQSYIELQGAIPWVKMQSGVKLDADTAEEYGLNRKTQSGDYLAKSYVLFGQGTRTTDSKGNISYTPDTSNTLLPGYTSTQDLGIRPKPGITGMSIASHNRFGSLRTATISFQVWSKEDMDAIEVLYMRPGMTVLLEWGHSKFVNEDSVDSALLGIDYFTSESRITAITAKIQAHRRSVNYSYDGIVGIVKNFSWKFRPDGGYDCQVTLVTAGDLIESYKANFLVSQKLAQREAAELMANYSGSLNLSNIEFPSIEYDEDTTDYAAFRAIAPIHTLFLDFIATAETAVSKLPELLQEKINDMAADFDSQKAFIGNGTGRASEINNIADSAKLQEIVDALKIFIGSLQVAKGGQFVEALAPVAQVRHSYLYRGPSYVFYRVEDPAFFSNLELESKWVDGIADLNTGNNDLVSGSLEDGYIALNLPNAEEEVNTVLEALNVDEFDFTARRATIERIFDTLLPALTVQVGNNNVNLFNNISGIPYISGEDPNLLDPQPPYDYDLPTFLHDGDGAKEDILRQAGNWASSDTWQEFVGGGRIYWGFNDDKPHWNRRTTIAIEKESLSLTNAQPEHPKVIRFAKAHFTGYKAIKDLEGNSTGVTAAVNANFQPTGEQVLVPNDTYDSKLHMYLRGRLYIPYANDHLKYSFIGKNFLEVFKYREVYPTTSSPPDEITGLFGDKDKGATTRLDNLKRYDRLSGNTYSKQLRSWNLLLGGRFIPHSGDPGYNVVYVKLGALLELLNRHVLKSDSSYFFLFNTIYSSAKNTHLYRTMDDHISSNPEICILPHQIKILGIEGRSGVPYLVDKDAPIILNIELSIDFILQTLSKYIDDQGQVTALTFIQEILDEISRVTGGINNLQLQYREDSSIFHVVDRNQVTPKGRVDYEETKLNVFGLNSIIKNINMVSKITPKLTSMIAISAQDSAFTSTQDSTGFGALNRGVTDRLFGERYDEDKKEKEEIGDSYDELRKNLLEDLVGLKSYLADYYYGITIPASGKDTQPGIYQNYCNFLFGADSKYRRGGRPSYNFIIPFQVELELYGISGIQVMDAFILSKDVLPKTYGGRKDSPIAFLVTGVEHKINQEGWSTLLKTQIFNIDENTPSRDYPLVDDIILSDLSSYATIAANVAVTAYDDLTASQKSTVHYLYKTCIDYGLNDMQARAVLGVCYKECSFVPKMEDSYGNTSFERLREVWSKFNQPPYAAEPGTTLVKDYWANEADFWDLIYQGRNGNDNPGDAFKYRGAGLNQVTGKANYGQVQQWYVDAGSPQGTIDIVSDPSSLNLPAGDGVYKVASHIAAIWFKKGARLTTGSQQDITRDIFLVNSGRGANLNHTSHQQGLAKAQKFVETLPATIPAP